MLTIRHLVALLPLTVLPSLLPAGTTESCAAKGICCSSIDEIHFVETAKPGIVLSGYVDAGYSYNFVGSNDVIADRGFTDDGNPQGDFNLYAAKFVLEKPLSDKNELQAGFRADLMVGEDAGNLGNNGAPNNSSSIYLQQAYAQFRLPIGNGLDIIVGKWQAIIGYEAEERPANPNITTGVVSLIDPSWYIGGLATYKITPQVEIALGGGNGSGLNNGASLENTDEAAATGYIGFTSPGQNASTYLGFHYAPWGDSGYAPENEPVLDLNWTGSWKPVFAQDKLLLAFNTSLATFNDFSAPTPVLTDDASTFFGVALYAKYQFNSLFSLAGRAEYAHSDDNQILPLPMPPPGGSGSNDIWTWTLTAGFDLAENMMVRAEYRLDYGDDIVLEPSGFTKDFTQMLAAEIVYSF